jgi:hypothetical protein
MSRRPGPLSLRVAATCEQLRASVGDLAGDLSAIQARLHQPLRVAVAGRVSSGKSTLVNALLGTRIAQTGETETTRVITRYMTADVERVEARFRNGDVRRLSLTIEGQLPPELGVPASEIEELVVQLPKPELLRSITLIDTPGLSSAHEDSAEAVTKALFSAASVRAIGGAEALLYVLDGTGMQDDVEAIDAFSQAARGLASSALNTVAVVSKADVLASGEDEPLAAAGLVASRRASLPEFRSRIVQIIPIIGILAETGRSNLLTDNDIAELQRAASSPEQLPEDWQEFVEDGEPSSVQNRQRLVELLKLYGVRSALKLLRHRPMDRYELTELIIGLSGVGELERVLAEELLTRADAIKADQALAALRTAAQRWPESTSSIETAIEACLLDPVMQPLRALAALNDIARGLVVVPPWLEQELRDYALQGQVFLADAAYSEEQVLLATRRVAHYAAAPTTDHRASQVAEALRQSYVALWEEKHGVDSQRADSSTPTDAGR